MGHASTGSACAGWGSAGPWTSGWWPVCSGVGRVGGLPAEATCVVAAGPGLPGRRCPAGGWCRLTGPSPFAPRPAQRPRRGTFIVHLRGRRVLEVAELDTGGQRRRDDVTIGVPRSPGSRGCAGPGFWIPAPAQEVLAQRGCPGGRPRPPAGGAGIPRPRAAKQHAGAEQRNPFPPQASPSQISRSPRW